MEPRTPPRSDPSAAGDDEVELGSVIGVFGVTGEVRLHLHNPASDLLRTPRSVILVAPDGARRRLKVSARSGAGKRILGRIEGVDDPDAARALQGAALRLPKAELPPVADDEVYVWQLEGAEVVVDGQPRGRVARVHPTGPVEILEIDVGRPEPAFVPVRPEFVLRFDVAARRVELAPDALDEG